MQLQSLRSFRARVFLATSLVALAVASAHCGGSDDEKTDNTPVAQVETGSFAGVFVTDSGTGTIEVELSNGKKPLVDGPLPSNARVRLGTTEVALTGNAAGTSLNVSGGGYTLDVTLQSGILVGTLTTPTGITVPVRLASGGTSISLFCGTFGGDRTGNLGIATSGTFAAGAIGASGEAASALIGTTTGGTVSLGPVAPGTTSVAGNVSGTSISGTWNDGAGKMGTFTASRSACPTGPNGAGGAAGAGGAGMGGTSGGNGGTTTGGGNGGSANGGNGNGGNGNGGANGGNGGNGAAGGGGAGAGGTTAGGAGGATAGAGGTVGGGAGGASAGMGGAGGDPSCNSLVQHANAALFNETSLLGSDDMIYKGGPVVPGTYVVDERAFSPMGTVQPMMMVKGTMVIQNIQPTDIPTDPFPPPVMGDPPLQYVSYERVIEYASGLVVRENGVMRFGHKDDFQNGEPIKMVGWRTCTTDPNPFAEVWTNRFSTSTQELIVKWRSNSAAYGPREHWVLQP